MLTLNESQRTAAEYEGPEDGILVLAGAGCGKTRTMIGRAIYLLEKKRVRPERLAMLTFTRRAAHEIDERLELELPGRHRGVFVGTIHRFCLNLIHRYPEEFGIEEVRIMDRSDEETILRRIRSMLLKRAGFEIRDTGILPKESGMASVFSYVNNTCIDLERYYEVEGCENPETRPLMEEALARYVEYKKTNRYLDFDDILSVVAVSLESNQELCAHVQWLFEHILVDEMQDTSPVQWRILSALYPKVKLFCVGDDAQSIYGFRGADFQSVHHFCERLPNSVTLKLTENYRSNQQILDVANVLLDDSSLAYNRRLVAHNGSGKVLPRLLTYFTEDQEAAGLVNLIADRLAFGTPPGEILVLMRSVVNGRRLEYELQRYGIDYRVVGGNTLMSSSHVKDAVCALEALTNPENEIAWIRFLTLFPRIGQKTVEKMVADSIREAGGDRNGMLRAIAGRLAPKAPDAARFIGRDVDADATPADLLGSIVDFLDGTGVMQKHYDHWKERKKDLDMLVSIAGRYPTVAEFLESFKLDPDSEAQPKDVSDTLTLSTVHGAKGTEADVVIVLHVQSGNYPHYRSQSPEEIEEERRILYVAMTRARKELFLTQCNFTRVGGHSVPSDFLTGNLMKTLRTGSRHS